jgi:hypothetical protein
MKNLRDAAGPHTRMISLDTVVPYTCPTEGKFPDIKGAEAAPVRYPLLPTLGPASSMSFLLDLQVRHGTSAAICDNGELINSPDR